MVDDGSHAAHGLALAIGYEVVGIAVLERRIAVAAKRVHLVEVEIRHVVWVVAIEIVAELYEFL